MIPRASWRAIKDRLGRRQAFIATTVDRAAIRTVIRNAHRHYAIARACDVLPISTMQWSSVMMHHDGSHIALVDVEQANAVSFLFARMAWLEHPIFSYIEFMIRAAETFYDDGDVTLAAAIAERANDRLWAYCRHHETEARVLRPVAIDELLPTILKSRLILAFITGHEIGHLVQASEDPGTQPLFDWVTARHDAINTDRKDPKLPFERFLEPEVTQKFDTDGVPTGFSIQTTKFARQFLHMRRQQIQETQADALGVILATQTAIDAGISVADLFGFFPKILEHTDMLMILRRTVARLPRGEKSSAIATERSSLFARLCLYLELVRGLRDGAVDAPAEVVAYWSGLAEQDLVTMEQVANDGTLDVLAMRAALMCRGGIEVGLHGKLSDPLPDDYHDLGPFGGNLSMAYAHRQLPDWLFRIETSFDWEPDDAAADAVVYGFAGAIRDITEISASETRSRWSVGRRDIMHEGSDAVFVELLRSARRQTVGRQLDTWWRGFETILRHRHEAARPA